MKLYAFSHYTFYIDDDTLYVNIYDSNDILSFYDYEAIICAKELVGKTIVIENMLVSGVRIYEYCNRKKVFFETKDYEVKYINCVQI